MTDRGLQIKVGALILVALSLLVGFVFLLGSFSVGKQRTYYVELADSGSILRGAPVKIAGVRAGRVEDVEFLVSRSARKSAPLGEGEAAINVRLRVTVKQDMAAAVRQDSEFYVTTQGVLGEKYLEIVPGTEASPEWPDASYIRGHDPARVDLIFAKVNSILRKVDEALTGSGDIDIGGLVDAITRLAKNVDQIVADHREQVDRILGNVETATGEAAQLATFLRGGIGSAESVGDIVGNVRRLSGVLARDAGPTLTAARSVMGTAEKAVGVVNGILERNEPHIDAAVANLAPISEHARASMRDAAAITAGMVRGRGTLGQIIIDQEIYDDLKEMLRDLKRHPWKMIWRE